MNDFVTPRPVAVHTIYDSFCTKTIQCSVKITFKQLQNSSKLSLPLKDLKMMKTIKAQNIKRVGIYNTSNRKEGKD